MIFRRDIDPFNKSSPRPAGILRCQLHKSYIAGKKICSRSRGGIVFCISTDSGSV